MKELQQKIITTSLNSSPRRLRLAQFDPSEWGSVSGEPDIEVDYIDPGDPVNGDEYTGGWGDAPIDFGDNSSN